MSGLEVSGVVFGVLPLVAKAIKHYEDFHLLFSRHAYTREISTLKRILQGREALFRSHCRILLEELIEENVLESMFTNAPSHPKWESDTDFETRFQRYLGDSYHSCLSTIQGIVECINNISNKLTKLDMNPPTPTEPDLSKWRQNASSRVQFVFSKDKISQGLEQLKDYNGELRDISAAVKELHKGRQRRRRRKNDLEVIRQSTKSREDLSMFSVIQQTSENLYQALQSATPCHDHLEHSASLCLDGCAVRDFQGQRVGFQVTFSANIDYLIRMNIESSTTILQTSLKRKSLVEGSDISKEYLTTCLKQQSKCYDSFSISALQSSVKRQQMTRLEQIVVGTPLLNNCLYTNELAPRLIQNFCIQMHQVLSSGQHAGYLRHGPCNHIIYGTSKKNGLQPKSLAELICSSQYRREIVQFPRLERLRLARLLAKAVLEFHDTHWVKDTWRSKDVHFFLEPNEINKGSLGTPNLIAQLVNSATKRKSVSTSSHGPDTTLDTPSSPAQNNLLFGLATILTELDHEQSLQQLQTTADLVPNLPQDTEFKTTNRVSKSTIPWLGPTYRSIIRKCLHCNFGIDEVDFRTSEELRTKFYQDVVCPLEELERALITCTL